MLRLPTLLLLAVLVGLSPASWAAAGNTTVRLRLPVESARPGDTFLAGVEFDLKSGWHTYWRNGGDSGGPATVVWNLPKGVTAGELQWPAPEWRKDEDLITYTYERPVTLLVPISIASDVKPGALELTARVKWLECEKQCVMKTGEIRATLTAGTQSSPSADSALVSRAAAQLPPQLPAGKADAVWSGPARGDSRTLELRWRPDSAAGTPDFFADAGTNYSASGATELRPTTDGSVVLRKEITLLEGTWPTEIRGLFVRLDAKHRPSSAFEAALPVMDPPAAPTARATASASPPAPASVAGPAATPAPSPSTRPTLAPFSLGRALFFGLLGGLILNVMPCVLPVIALKILGFVRQGGSDPARVRKLGIVYGIGVWFSFLVLAGLVVGVKKAAGIASWGMQFGNPVFLVALTALILLVALSLFGVFEINPTGRALDAAGELASREGPAGAFLNGMLAVALATPCTAPFLAPALGYAFAADAPTIVLVFSAVAVGLAAPYVILSWQPVWLRFLPKPGAWMEHFKVAMGFPMLATALWLYTLAAAHFDDAGPLWLGVFLVGLSLAAWIWGEFSQRGRRHPTAALVIALVVAGGSYAFALERELNWRHPEPPPAPTAAAKPGAPNPAGIDWQPWSRDAVMRAREARRPVFVDFTADWCLTCKVNERSSINTRAVREKLLASNTVTLKGDHTRLPPAITEELQRWGRAGVPLVLVYPRDPSKDPIPLPEFLTEGIVLGALEEATK